MDADKESTSKLKKIVKQAARVVQKDSAEALRSDHTSIERVLEKIGVL